MPRPLRLRRAAAALAEARADARRRGDWPADPPGPAHGQPARDGEHDQPAEGSGGDAAGQLSRRRRRDDPQPLGTAIGGLLSARDWRQRAALGAVFGDWARIVGPELAAHTRPDGFADGELVVVADSTAWATQVRLLAAMLVRRVNAEVGGSVVRRVKVRGPAAPRRPGRWRVPGSRGPRDTYG